MAALVALVGHNWPVFLGFRGGRGHSDGAGRAFDDDAGAGCGSNGYLAGYRLREPLHLAGFDSWGVAGAASLIGLALAGWYSETYMIFAGVAAAMIIWQHRDNIRRLANGNERRIGAPAAPVE